MNPRSIRNGLGVLLAAALLLAAAPASVPDAFGEPKTKKAKADQAERQASRPRRRSTNTCAPAPRSRRSSTPIGTTSPRKRRARIAKRRDKQEIVLEDYVLTQPPVYAGPPRPAGMPPPRKEPRDVKLPPIPRVADFIKAAAEHFKFVPQRPDSDLEFKRAYARVAIAAGVTEDQAVRIYAFETGGNGTYDVQAGLTHPKKGSKPISPAIGYNQLLSTNSIGLLAANGDHFVEVLKAAGRGARRRRAQGDGPQDRGARAA